MTPRDVRDHDAVLAALRDNRPFLFVRPLPTSLHARDKLDPPYRRGLGFDLKVNIRVENDRCSSAGIMSSLVADLRMWTEHRYRKSSHDAKSRKAVTGN